jgi:cell wall-associated NlpC family hydrolase
MDPVQRILAAVAAKHADRRLHVFDVRAEEASGGAIKLTGKVLDTATLQSLRRAIAEDAPQLRVDDSGIRILRCHPPAVQVVATNLTGLLAEPRHLSEQLSQVTNGYPLEVLEEEGNWARVRQPDGYLGWVDKRYLVWAGPIEATHMVGAPFTWIYRDTRRDSEPLSCLPIGTAVRLSEQQSDWARVQPVGEMLPAGWVAMSHLRSAAHLPLPPIDARRQMVADARRLFGVPYVWGGTTAFGIDCSGLAQLAYRLAGYPIPRDTSLQFPAGCPVDPPYQPGDLFFFHSDTDATKISHVGLCTGGWNMIHSSRRRNGVYEEDVQAVESLKETFAGARNFFE